jgi:5-methylcytosine-specific restriction endonuclease McrA
MMKIPRGQTPERRAYMKAYAESHPRPDRRAYKAAYDAAHKEEARAYREANKVRLRAQKAALHIKQREANIARANAWIVANKERFLAYRRKYYAENKDKIKAWHAPWGLANADKRVLYASRRRAKKAGNGGSHTLAERREKFASLGNVCFYCFQQTKLTVDHDIPIVRGGTDNIDNILPACEACNKSKGTLTAQEFIASGRYARTNHTKIGGVQTGYTGR